MRTSNIIFSNLRAEMARKQITIKKIAELLEINRDTAGRKLSGKAPLYLSEALVINKELFPNKNVTYLFKELVPNKKVS
ncbi:XRE family transcriptional regulator [Clostridium perfringens]|uniref:XRE family transcriptional regulator n=1 Tax=Clostridium perfringens TaxID=1502 RepID=UPI0018E43576|nr:XRE family transcriptional regulator [Clostridium perfringens]MDM0796794.1 XRE family transcriptional regulator [Clostridium perfringens]MDM0860795.1 XRE family transcriptional regulator [Clostridium perfringens]